MFVLLWFHPPIEQQTHSLISAHFHSIESEFDKNRILSCNEYKVLPRPNVYYIFEKQGVQGYMNMAFAPKFSTKKFPLQIFHEKFFSTKIFPPVYSYPEYLSFAQFTWFSFSFSSIVFFRLALLWSCFSFSLIVFFCLALLWSCFSFSSIVLFHLPPG